MNKTTATISNICGCIIGCIFLIFGFNPIVIKWTENTLSNLLMWVVSGFAVGICSSAATNAVLTFLSKKLKKKRKK